MPTALMLMLAWATIVCGAEPNDSREDRFQVLVYRDAGGEPHPVKSPADWQIRRRSILAGLQQAMGPLPDLKQSPPLEMQIRGESFQGDGYRRLTISYV